MPRSLFVSSMVDPTLDRVGFPLEHPYVEQVWLSIVGPTSVLALRHLGRRLDAQPAGVTVDVVELSRSLGLQAKDSVELGRNSQLGRTLERLVQFHFAAWLGDDRLSVHRKVPAVTSHRVERLPESVRSLHHELLGEHLDGLARPAATPAPTTAPSTAARLAAVAARDSRREISSRERGPLAEPRSQVSCRDGGWRPFVASPRATTTRHVPESRFEHRHSVTSTEAKKRSPSVTMSSGGTALPIIVERIVRFFVGQVNQSGNVCRRAASCGVIVRRSLGCT